jgi:phosphopantetheinyl transferase (holo-ACP synthase)
VSACAVGNDVVDLTDPHIARHHENERFVARICAGQERERVATARDLWALFAAKEASYKALVKLGGSRLGPRSIRVAPDLASVSCGNLRLELRVTGDRDHVHAVVWTRERPPVARAVRAEGPEHEEGDRARAVLGSIVAMAIGCASEELAVVRDLVPGAWDGRAPPRIERRGVRLEADVSLSHDGHYVAAAALV